ncbi:hypothetical protein EON65_07905 [archaeon]|nr:MAG: hypothetical protein EON65_07905 [archaeon]
MLNLISSLYSVLIVFSSNVFVIITQINKVGSMLKAWTEPKFDGGLRFMVENMLGRRDDPLLVLYARQLIERISIISPKQLILAVSLKEEGRGKEHFQNVINRTMDELSKLLA